MSSNPTRRLPPAAGRTNVETLELQEFARRLHDARVAKGLSQSDLARAIWGEAKDARGYSVARNRERISAYERGASLPEPANLRKIAEVLGVDHMDLAPTITASTIDREKPAMSMTMVEGHTDRVHLQVNTITTLEVASRVIALIADAKNATSRRLAGGGAERVAA